MRDRGKNKPVDSRKTNTSGEARLDGAQRIKYLIWMGEGMGSKTSVEP